MRLTYGTRDLADDETVATTGISKHATLRVHIGGLLGGGRSMGGAGGQQAGAPSKKKRDREGSEEASPEQQQGSGATRRSSPRLSVRIANISKDSVMASCATARGFSIVKHEIRSIENALFDSLRYCLVEDLEHTDIIISNTPKRLKQEHQSLSCFSGDDLRGDVLRYIKDHSDLRFKVTPDTIGKIKNGITLRDSLDDFDKQV
mmetsp:Transcript_51233/g.127564  ORF Transcript_51233/g.127564 Transcript_51233/m.127564 type:complete len:204 (+) Transcript_51233:34-645(+)